MSYMCRTWSGSSGATTRPRPGASQQHALVAQQQQRLLHRLARDTQCLRDLFLDDAFARRQLARGDLAEDRVTHLLDEVGGQDQGLHGRECNHFVEH